jgi:Cytochrome c oxidase assembly protein CtaG/Cox11
MLMFTRLIAFMATSATALAAGAALAATGQPEPWQLGLQQRLKAGETREMAVVFYIDPSIVKDRDQNDLSTITLSYAFYRLREPEQPVADAPDRNSNRL